VSSGLPQAKLKKQNLKTVAAELGVSVATVSNAFNRPDQLSPELRLKILAQCEVLGYSGPNAAARSLRTGKSGIIAILLSDTLEYSVSDPVANQLIKGVAEVLQQQGRDLLLLSGTHNSRSSSAEAVPDGFILYGAPNNPEQLGRILRQQKPMITVDCNVEDLPSVNIDNFSSAKQIALHAFASMPGKIAVLGLRLIESDRVCRIQPDELYRSEQAISRRRLEGYLAAAKEASRELPAEAVWHIPVNQHEQALMAAREALQQAIRPSVLLCMSDRIALAAMMVARELGIEIPSQLVVVGFDGIEEGERFYPALTTIQQYSAEKGRLAASRLLAGELSGDVELQCDLVVRQSC
jgi:DNA-binding LacI/PurR family transcriptional regulator